MFSVTNIFVLAMQLLLKVTENNADILELGRGFKMQLVKAFMNDYYNPIIQRINYSPDGRADNLV